MSCRCFTDVEARSIPIALAILLVGGCSVSPTGTPTGSRQPSASPATPTPSISAVWQAVPDQTALTGVAFNDVVWTGMRFVASGRAEEAGVFLDSPDGLTWHRQASLGQDSEPGHLASGGTVVAVGRSGDHWSSWWSRDGLTWTVTRDAFATVIPTGHSFRVTDVAASAEVFVAVGREDSLCCTSDALTAVRALAWTSSDGVHWTAVPSQAPLVGGAMETIAHGDVGFVAAGTANAAAAFWTSRDGLRWTRVADVALFHNEPREGVDATSWVDVTGVAAGHAGTVALGADVPGGGHLLPRAWWSRDGTTWAKGGGFDFVDLLLNSVAATDRGFLATGAPACPGAIWSSADGRSWRCTSADTSLTGIYPQAAAGSPRLEVVVGSRGAWYRPAS